MMNEVSSRFGEASRLFFRYKTNPRPNLLASLNLLEIPFNPKREA
jgi:hypothetical protein